MDYQFDFNYTYSKCIDLSSGQAFGKYTTTVGGPRVFQFSARYEF